MADTAQHPSHAPLIRAIWASVVGAFDQVSQRTARYQAVVHLNALTDAELDRMGTTRLEEIKRIFGGQPQL